jgi:hypothetical protein
MALAFLSDEYRYPTFLNDARETLYGITPVNDKMLLIVNMIELYKELNQKYTSTKEIEHRISQYQADLKKREKEIDDDNFIAEYNQILASLKPTEFYIKDETKYSESFLTEFKKRHSLYETVSLIDDTIIILNDRSELILIPTDLPLNQLVIYEKTDKEKEQILTVERINISTIEYNCYEIVNGRKTNERQGMADLQADFYYGAEGIFYADDDESLFGMNRYIDRSEKDCWTYVYIGVGSIEKAFLIYDCEEDGYGFRTSELTRRN